MEAIDAYADAGFRQVEFYLPLVKAWPAEGRTRVDVVGLLERIGPKAIDGFELPILGLGSDEVIADNYRRHRENAALIHVLGGGTLVVGMDGPVAPSVEALPILADAIQRFADAISDLAVTVALEFNRGPLVKSLAGAVAVCELVGQSNVGILFDPALYHCTVTKFGDLDERSIPWDRHLHLDDIQDMPDELSNFNSDQAPPSGGILDFDDLIARIKTDGYAGSFSIEMFNHDLWALPAAEAARRCYRSLPPLCDS